MAALKKQPTPNPTRKLWAVIIAGGVIGMVKTLVNTYWPDNPLDPYWQDVGFWIEGALMVAAGYMTKERA